MSFQNLNRDELLEVAAFFNKDVVVADETKGATKKELIAALASAEDGADPVSLDDYKEIYLVAKANGTLGDPLDKAAKEAAEKELALKEQEEEAKREAEVADLRAAEEARAAAAEADVEKAPAVQEHAQVQHDFPRQEAPASQPYIVKMERKNPSFEIRGVLFTQEHPYQPVSLEIAEYLIKNVEGFRIALPSEVSEYY